MLKKIRLFFNDLPLRMKFLLMTVGLTACFAAAAMYSYYQTVAEAFNEQLYQTVALSMSSHARKLSDSLASLENMTLVFIGDSNIQKIFNTEEEENAGLSNSMAASRMSSILRTYKNQYSSVGIQYLTFYGNDFSASTNTAAMHSVPQEVWDEVILRAQEADGSFCICTDWSQTYGVFMARKIQQITPFTLDDLGVLVVCVDPEQMLSQAIGQNPFAEGSLYLLQSDDQIILSSDQLDTDQIVPEEHKEGSYTLLDYDGHLYLTVNVGFSDYNWELVYLVPYDDIYRARNQAYGRYMVLFAMLLFLFLGTSIYFSHSLTRSFDQLCKKMEAFGEGDGLTLPEETEEYQLRRDEIGRLYRYFDRMAERIIKLIRDNYEAELLAIEAQLKALQAQINPHFLYNTLASMSFQARMIQADNIVRMIDALSEVLRASLTPDRYDYTIEKEFGLVLSYLTIQQIRFESRLQYTIDMDEELKDVIIPKIIVQPLVENAIEYALENMIEVCHIAISARRQGDRIIIRVQNDGSQFEEDLMEHLSDGTQNPHGFGIGLLNIHRRIQMMYGENFGLQVFNQDSFAVAQITLPYQESAAFLGKGGDKPCSE